MGLLAVVGAIAAGAPAEARAAAKGKDVPSLPVPKAAKPKKTAKSARATKATRQGPIAILPGFAMRSDGTSVVYVELTGPAQVEEHVAKGFVTYVLKDTLIDRANNKNPLETAFYDTPVLRAQLRGVKKEPDAELVIELRAEVKPTYKVLTEKGQSRLEVVFPAGQYARADLDPAEVARGARAPRRESAPKESAAKSKKASSATTERGRDDSRKGPKVP